MGRIRSIKPEFWSSPTLARVSRESRLTFVGLWNQADDAGRCEAIPRMLLGALYPYDDDVDEHDLVAWIDELASVGVIRLYEHRGRRYLHCTGWDEHQRIDKPSKPRCPDPDDPESIPLDSLTSDSRDLRESVARVSRDSSDRSVGASERRSIGGEDDADASSPAPDPATNGQQPDPVDESFESFWNRYPRHHVSAKPGGGGSRKKALQRWRRLTQAERDAALAAVDHYRAWVESPAGEYAAHATTWLNDARWEQWQEPAARTRDGPADRSWEHLDPTDPSGWIDDA